MWVRRGLAIWHVLWGLALVAIGVVIAVTAFRILPHMSTGITLSNLLVAAGLAGMNAGPPAALGVWLLVLARRLWRADPAVRRALVITHGLLLVPAAGGIALGIAAVRAAARSEAAGGGLMGSVAYLPIALGSFVALLSLSSIAAALARGVASGDTR